MPSIHNASREYMRNRRHEEKLSLQLSRVENCNQPDMHLRMNAPLPQVSLTQYGTTLKLTVI